MSIDDLISRYGGAVPRYTSYPPAPHFAPIREPAGIFDRLAALGAETDVSLYLHVPFCPALCLFCGCHTSVVRSPELLADYAAGLRSEIRLLARTIGRRATVRRVHWGGGTPSVLGPVDLTATMECLRQHFIFADDCEVAIEIDPRRLTPPLLSALPTMGVSRVSLGVQDFDTRVQETVRRVQPFCLVLDAVTALRRAEVRAISFDLMYGLPYQTVESVAATARQAARLDPDRLAVFGYAHVPWLKRHQKLLPESALPGARARYDEQQAIADVLRGAGYQALGLDHFARPGDALSRAAADGRLRRNFQGYTDEPASVLLGIGASAISSFPDAYVQNASRVSEWRGAVAAGELPFARGICLSAEDLLRRDVIEQIMCRLEVDLAAIAARHTVPLASLLDPRLTIFAADGLIDWDGSRLAVTAQGRPFLRAIAALFDAYALAEPAGPRYSRAL